MRYCRLFVGTVACVALVSVVLFAAEGGAEAKKLDIVDTAIKAGNFTTLVQALKDAGLVETLKGEGPFTVFAPTDAAWEKIPEERRAALLSVDDERSKIRLTEVLQNHVVAGRLMAADIAGMETVTTMVENQVKVKVEDDKVMLGDATITTADIECSNGVIHVIDTVMVLEK